MLRYLPVQRADVFALSVAERVALFINVYNALVIHATIVYGRPTNTLARLAFFAHAAYRIGPYKFTLNDIEHGVLRASRRGPGSLLR